VSYHLFGIQVGHESLNVQPDSVGVGDTYADCLVDIGDNSVVVESKEGDDVAANLFSARDQHSLSIAEALGEVGS
jgi:hypothetical protein